MPEFFTQLFLYTSPDGAANDNTPLFADAPTAIRALLARHRFVSELDVSQLTLDEVRVRKRFLARFPTVMSRLLQQL